MQTTHTRSPLRLAALAALGLAAAHAAHAQGFQGSYDPSKFTTTASAGTATLSTAGAPAAMGFLYAYDNTANTGAGAQKYTYTVTAAGTGTVTFDYDYSGNNAFFLANASLSLVDVTAGTSVALVAAGSSTFGAFDFKGTGTIAVAQGDTFGLLAGGGNEDSTSTLQGDVAVTNFIAPAPAAAPEPSSVAVLCPGVLGVGALILMARRRKTLAG